jgi:radical SAM protein with 4Fe4S-binding SPASM domain
MPISDISCVLPFNQVVIRTDGKISPCCIITGVQSVTDTTISDYWKNSHTINIRNQIANGTTPLKNECRTCYKDDIDGSPSMRKDSFRDTTEEKYNWLVNNKDTITYPEKLEFHVSNICNLKCLTCRPEDSSLFLTEDRILKISNHNQMDYQIDEQIIANTIQDALNNRIESIDLRGGETLMVPVIKKMLSELPEEVCKETNIRFQTNATLIDDEWINIFNKFKNTKVHLSIDGYGERNNYIRFPSKWEEIDRNVDNLLKNMKSNVLPYVVCTVSNLNLLFLDELITWTKSKNIHFYWARLHKPLYYYCGNMPIDLFNLAKEKLSKFDEVNEIMDTVHNDNKWEDFCKMISIRDAHRRNSIFDYIPEFKEYWLQK